VETRTGYYTMDFDSITTLSYGAYSILLSAFLSGGGCGG